MIGANKLPSVICLVLAMSMVYVLFRIKRMEESMSVLRQHQTCQLSVEDVQQIMQKDESAAGGAEAQHKEEEETNTSGAEETPSQTDIADKPAQAAQSEATAQSEAAAQAAKAAQAQTSQAQTSQAQTSQALHASVPAVPVAAN